MTLNDAIKYFGNMTQITKALGMARTNGSGWKKYGKIPLIVQFKIEKVTGGALKADAS